MIYTAVYRCHCLLKIYELFVSRNVSFESLTFHRMNQNVAGSNNSIMKKFDDLISRENLNKNPKYLADVTFTKGYEVLKDLGFKVTKVDESAIKFKGKSFNFNS